MRRLRLRLRTLDPNGKETASQDKWLGRVLVDKTGKMAPHYQATGVGSDTRIGPKESRTESVRLAAPGAGSVHVQVVWYAMPPTLAKRIGMTEAIETHLMTEAKIPLVAPSAAGKRAGLPKSLRVRAMRKGKHKGKTGRPVKAAGKSKGQ